MEVSNKTHKIRRATEEDAKAVLEIYSPFILNTPTTFETEIPTIEDIKSRIRNTLVHLPWLVYEDENGTVGGYAYAGVFRNRPGYQWTAETSIYISPDYVGLGIARELYSEIFRILLKQGYYKVLALTEGDNERSVTFHLKMGFSIIGKGSNIGNKFGKWVDVYWFEKDLQVMKDNPSAPMPYSQL